MSPDLAEHLTRTIVSCGGEAASALANLIFAVADPDGDKHRLETAWIVIRRAMPFVPDFDEVCKDRCERSISEPASVARISPSEEVQS